MGRDTLQKFEHGGPRSSDAWIIAAVAAVLRFSVVLWAARRFPPAADGQFYHVVAQRIAAGDGYTWLWPDGAVTFAAHYPVGYPAIVGAWYWALGPEPWLAMVFNALVGSVAVVATYFLAAEFGTRRGACLAAALAALHPSLVMYTPALMTEGVTAACLGIAGWVALGLARRASKRRLVSLGVVFGGLTLLRPQMLLLAPVFAALGVESAQGAWRRRVERAVVVSAVCLAVCAPWTLRNCVHMDRCMLVSANAGWNLLIGTSQKGNGAWISLDEMGVPRACRDVFQEAEKDACFGRAAWQKIREQPLSWLSLVPAKLAATFDYPAAPAHYLHMSNPKAFDAFWKDRLGLLETIWQRAVLALGLFGLAGPRRFERRWWRSWRAVVATLGVLSLLTPSAVFGVVAFVVLGLSQVLSARQRIPVHMAAFSLAATALMHAVFFGAGRYSLVVSYLMAAVVGAVFTQRAPDQQAAGS